LFWRRLNNRSSVQLHCINAALKTLEAVQASNFFHIHLLRTSLSRNPKGLHALFSNRQRAHQPLLRLYLGQDPPHPRLHSVLRRRCTPLRGNLFSSNELSVAWAVPLSSFAYKVELF
jgi:hypothetical protein